MNRKYFRGSAVAVLCSATVVVAQAGASGQAQQPQSQPTTQQMPASSQPSTTLTGCVYSEKDVPGRSPNIAERAGVLEDYILAEVTPKQAEGASSTATPGAAGTSGTVKPGAMYKLELVGDDKLKTLVGKRVEVTGRIDAERGDKTDPAADSANDAHR